MNVGYKTSENINENAGKGQRERIATNSSANSTYCPLRRCQGRATLPACLNWMWVNPDSSMRLDLLNSCILNSYSYGYFAVEAIENNWIEKLVCIIKVTCSSSVCSSIPKERHVRYAQRNSKLKFALREQIGMIGRLYDWNAVTIDTVKRN